MLANKALSAAPSAVPVYIEDVFSTYLYTGNGSTQTITNNIDLSTKGGLVWTKGRSNADNHGLYDTARGATKYLMCNLTNAETTRSDGLTAFTSTGYTLGADAATESTNANAHTYASWTFAKQAKFFDVVTYTGTGTTMTVAHNLGSVPGCIIVKRTDSAGGWAVFHRAANSVTSDPPQSTQLILNTTAAATQSPYWNDTLPTSTVFTVKGGEVPNINGATYVAYLFAHDAGGFGDDGSENVISCGSYTGSNTVQTSVNLGYEPQLVLIKNITTAGNNWAMFDNMRGVATGGVDAQLIPNSANAEVNTTDWLSFTSTGFQLIPLNNGTVNRDANTYIYIAIRRGPMKTPESGTSVYKPTGTSSPNPQYKNLGFNPDFIINKDGGQNGTGAYMAGARLTGQFLLYPASTAAQADASPYLNWAYQNGAWDSAFTPGFGWTFGRAPGFFDVVCYTGSGSTRYVDHNLTVAPELLIVKNRTASPEDWSVYVAALGNTSRLKLNLTDAVQTGVTHWGSTTPTATQFRVGTQSSVNGSGNALVAYLFATCPGVSKVFSYTGNGSSQTINCGFTGGARFVLIKRTDSTGDWYVWDSARGIVAGNDPHLSLNNTAAQVTTDDSVDTASTGFIVNQDAATNVNVSSATYVGLAIA